MTEAGRTAMISSLPQSLYDEGTINLTGEAGVTVTSPPDLGDCATRTVAAHEPSPFRSRPYGWASTIARLSLSNAPTRVPVAAPRCSTGEAGATNLPTLFEQAVVAAILLACLAIPAIFAGA